MWTLCRHATISKNLSFPVSWQIATMTVTFISSAEDLTVQSNTIFGSFDRFFLFFFYPPQFTVLFITIEKQCKNINDKNIQTAFRGLRHQRELQGRAAVRLTDLAVFMKKRQSVWLTLKQRKKNKQMQETD